MELTQQQIEAVEKFKKLRVGALFMKMGTGKTRVALELVSYNKPDFLMYLCPTSAKDNIEAEFQKWGISCPYAIYGYESIAGSDRIFAEALGCLDDSKNNFIIADESIYIKSGRAKRLKRAKELRSHCRWALILNGTPLVRNEWDLFNQFNFLSESIIKMRSYEFIEKFFVEHLVRNNGREKFFYTFYEPNRPALMKIISPYVYECNLDFQHGERDRTVWVPPTRRESEAYKAAMEEVFQKTFENEDAFIQLFGALNRQASITRSKCERVAEYISDKRIICFCNYQEEVKMIRELCSCYVITGETGIRERAKIIRQFEHDVKPLVMTLGVGSYSLNLQFCNEIVYSSVSFNYGAMEQSKYRIKRVGQENDIMYTYILADFRINEMIFKNLDRKESLADIVNRLVAEYRKETEKDLAEGLPEIHKEEKDERKP